MEADLSAPSHCHVVCGSVLGAEAAFYRGFLHLYFDPSILVIFRVARFRTYHPFLAFFPYLSSPWGRWLGCAS